MHQIQLQQFSGPLDLLLSLIEDEKMDITTVSLSTVTEQYLKYIDEHEEIPAEELADFLTVAAKLLLLKSKLLLPKFLPEEDEEPDLASQLRLYKAFVEASRTVHRLWLSEKRGVFRVEPVRKVEGFVPPENVTVDSLHTRMVQLLKRLKPLKALPKTTIDKTVSLKEKIHHIRMLLSKDKKVLFHEVLDNTRNKTEVIVGFLALLELVKQRSAILQQDETFSDIVIEGL